MLKELLLSAIEFPDFQANLAPLLDKYKLIEGIERKALSGTPKLADNTSFGVCANQSEIAKVDKSENAHHRKRVEIHNVPILEWNAEYQEENTKDHLAQHQQ